MAAAELDASINDAGSLLNEEQIQQLDSLADTDELITEATDNDKQGTLSEQQKAEIREQAEQAPEVDDQATDQEQALAEDFDLADIDDLDVDDFESLNLDQQQEDFDEK